MLKLRKTNLTQQELFRDENGNALISLERLGSFGFLNRAKCMSYDPILSLLAIGSKAGVIKVVGKIGVEFEYAFENPTEVDRLLFLPKKNGFIALGSSTGRQFLSMFMFIDESGSTKLDMVSYRLIEKANTITKFIASQDQTLLYVGTESGHVIPLAISDFAFKEVIITQDFLTESEDHCVRGFGAIEDLALNPTACHQLLVGYRAGVIVLWDLENFCSVFITHTIEEIESIAWNNFGTMFASSHTEGKIMVWPLIKTSKELKNKVNRGSIVGKPISMTPYNPERCRPVRKIEWHNSSFVFSGGYPYSDSLKQAVTVMTGSKISHAYEVHSSIIDYTVITRRNAYPSKNATDDSPFDATNQYIIILTEEELIIMPFSIGSLDVASVKMDNIPYIAPFKEGFIPHFPCIQFSNITSMKLLTACSDLFINNLMYHGKIIGMYQEKDWPVHGGYQGNQKLYRNDVIVTGHENGSVLFWWAQPQATALAMTKIETILFYDVWTPSQKVQHLHTSYGKPYVLYSSGVYESFCEDPRLAIQKIDICTSQSLIFLGGSAGNVMIISLDKLSNGKTIPQDIRCRLSDNLGSYKWQGNAPLKLRSMDISEDKILLQHITVDPPAPIENLHSNQKYNILAIGTCHGYLIYNYAARHYLFGFLTVNPKNAFATGVNIQRRSFVRTLRKSLRGITSRCSGRRGRVVNYAEINNKKMRQGSFRRAKNITTDESVHTDKNESNCHPKGRNIEVSVVRKPTLFSGSIRSFRIIESNQDDKMFLIAGSQTGKVYVNSMKIEPYKDFRTPLVCETLKEYKLNHGAPVVEIFCLDAQKRPIFDEETSCSQLSCSSVIVATEEQIKNVSFPSWRLQAKYKYSAHTGNRIRKISFTKCSGSINSSVHHYIVALSNNGEITLFHPEKLQLLRTLKFLSDVDVRAIHSTVFSYTGYGYYLKTHSELQKFSLSTSECLVMKPFLPNMEKNVEYKPKERNLFEILNKINISTGDSLE